MAHTVVGMSILYMYIYVYSLRLKPKPVNWNIMQIDMIAQFLSLSIMIVSGLEVKYHRVMHNMIDDAYIAVRVYKPRVDG